MCCQTTLQNINVRKTATAWNVYCYLRCMVMVFPKVIQQQLEAFLINSSVSNTTQGQSGTHCKLLRKYAVPTWQQFSERQVDGIWSDNARPPRMTRNLSPQHVTNLPLCIFLGLQIHTTTYRSATQLYTNAWHAEMSQITETDISNEVVQTCFTPELNIDLSYFAAVMWATI